MDTSPFRVNIRGAALRMAYPEDYRYQKFDIEILISIINQKRHFQQVNLLALFNFVKLDLGDGKVGVGQRARNRLIRDGYLIL